VGLSGWPYKALLVYYYFIMKIFAQVLGTDTGDTCPTLLLFFDNKRYLFNCGEGTQRFATEHKVKLTKIDTLFFTRVAWEHLGGLPGSFAPPADILASAEIYRTCHPDVTQQYIHTVVIHIFLDFFFFFFFFFFFCVYVVTSSQASSSP
jgi:hypothetical protein